MPQPSPTLPRAACGLALLAAMGLSAVGCTSTGDSQRTTQRGESARTSSPTAQTRSVDTGGAEADGLSIERTMPPQVYANSQTQYKLKVSNTGDLNLHNVVLHESVSSGFEIERGDRPGYTPDLKPSQSSAKQSDSTQMNEAQYRIGMLKPGESREVTVYGTATEEGMIDTCTWATYDAASCQSFQVVKPELTLDHRFVNAAGETINSAYACDEVFIVYRLTNTGSGATPAVTVNETLPQGVARAQGSGPMKVDAGSIAAGKAFESKPMKVDLEKVEADSIRARAVASAGSMSEVADGSTLRVYKPSIDLSVQAPEQEYVGRDTRLGVTVENTSDAPAKNVVVNLPLPANARNLSVSDGRVQRSGSGFTMPELPAGESRSFNVTFTTTEPSAVEGKATAKAYCAAPVSKPLNVKFVGIPALQLEVVDAQDPVKIGEETVYSIRLTNEGSAEDLDVKITATMPEHFSFVSASGEPMGKADGRTITFDPIGVLKPGEERAMSVRVKADDAGQGSLAVEVESEQLTTPLSEEESTTAY